MVLSKDAGRTTAQCGLTPAHLVAQLGATCVVDSLLIWGLTVRSSVDILLVA